eukprot:TRINITY_DN2436_c0_g1_i1.p1 TRINITY_DN2436_c0_g1~~TRINITY_DN2436_c0_g1_i1.p1  ORF type:complete len:252 (+),score=31.62 TRINITY_DN2436_c0_g1_i1:54-809(+)
MMDKGMNIKEVIAISKLQQNGNPEDYALLLNGDTEVDDSSNLIHDDICTLILKDKTKPQHGFPKTKFEYGTLKVTGVLPISLKMFASDPSKPLFVDSLEGYCAEQGIELDTVKTLDLSHNFLEDEDMEYIEKFISKLPNCEIVDLSHNTIYGFFESERNEVDKRLISILSRMKYVVVHNNPVASISRSDLFWKISALDKRLLASLIWIPENWVKTPAWKRLVNPDDIDLIEESHLEHMSGSETSIKDEPWL